MYSGSKCNKCFQVISELINNGIRCSICLFNFHTTCVPSKSTKLPDSWICNLCELPRVGNRSTVTSTTCSIMIKIGAILSTLEVGS